MDPAPEPIAPSPLGETLARASAGFWIRFLARFVDLLFTFCLGFFSGIVVAIILTVLARLGKISPDWSLHLRTHPFSFRGAGIGLVCSLLYHVLCEGTCGTTVGKLCCGLRVVQLDGRSCTLAGAFKRALAYLWDALFFGLVAWSSMSDSPTRQRFGDRWARTVVVRKEFFSPTPAPETWRYPAGIAAGALILVLGQVAGILLRGFYP